MRHDKAVPDSDLRSQILTTLACVAVLVPTVAIVRHLAEDVAGLSPWVSVVVLAAASATLSWLTRARPPASPTARDAVFGAGILTLLLSLYALSDATGIDEAVVVWAAVPVALLLRLAVTVRDRRRRDDSARTPPW